MAEFADLAAYSLTSLRHRKLRSVLTIIGVVIGIAAIVSLVSIGDGLSASVSDQLKAFGARSIAIVPGDITRQFALSGGPSRPPAAGKLFDNDLERIKKVPGIEYSSRAITAKVTASYKESQVSATITGVEPDIIKTSNALEITQGRFLSDGDGHVVVVGSQLTDKSLFKDEMGLGSIIKLGSNNESFRVVGILKKTGRGPSDMIMYVPLEHARDLAGDTISDKEISAIRVTVAEGYDIDEVQSQIESELAAAHRVKLDEKDFSLVTAQSILKTVNVIIGLITAFLGFVASIALVVGGIGIANTMFMSVVERTREIGILKSIGASDQDVLSLILIESAIIGLIGGLVGLGLGVGICAIIDKVASGSGFYTVTTPYLAAFVMAFSVVVGMASGYFPAKQAARLSPIVAISKE